MEREITGRTRLLGSMKQLEAEGWGRKPYWQYRRKELGTHSFRIKEWDYYQIISRDGDFALNVTFSDLGLFSLISLSFVERNLKEYSQQSAIKFFTKNRMGLAESPDDDYSFTYANEDIAATAVKKGRKRHIIANCPKLSIPGKKQGIIADLTIYDDEAESMNICTSWKEDRKKFYYNEKRGPMRAEGVIWFDLEKYEINDAYALLDWGRGIWLRSSTWIWAALMDERYLINLGGGFTDRSPASENAVIYDNVVNKLEDVEISVPEDLERGVWRFKEKNGRLFLEMHPAVNRKDHQDYKLIKSFQDQVFGTYSGYFILDSGEKIEVRDKFGFAEKVYNKW